MIKKGKKRIQITLSIETMAKLKDLSKNNSSYFYKMTKSQIIETMIEMEVIPHD